MCGKGLASCGEGLVRDGEHAHEKSSDEDAAKKKTLGKIQHDRKPIVPFWLMDTESPSGSMRLSS